ncbi:MAG: hypothetical protein HN849_30675, partial [Victivallales bacterium]|nr:hypothetical protein [Victivallales bacterium]
MELRETFGTSTARLCDGALTIGTGKMERTWRWTGDGFSSVALRDLSSGAEWAGDAANADWRLPGWRDANPPAELVSVTAGEDSDEGFTSPHLAVVAEMLYPAAKLRLRFTVWAYPGAMGLRTQLEVQALAGYEGEVARSSGRA